MGSSVFGVIFTLAVPASSWAAPCWMASNPMNNVRKKYFIWKFLMLAGDNSIDDRCNIRRKRVEMSRSCFCKDLYIPAQLPVFLFHLLCIGGIPGVLITAYMQKRNAGLCQGRQAVRQRGLCPETAEHGVFSIDTGYFLRVSDSPVINLAATRAGAFHDRLF